MEGCQGFTPLSHTLLLCALASRPVDGLGAFAFRPDSTHPPLRIHECAALAMQLDDQHVQPLLAWNWYSAWSPSSEAANRKPLRMTQMEEVGGMVSKYLTCMSRTISPS